MRKCVFLLVLGILVFGYCPAMAENAEKGESKAEIAESHEKKVHNVADLLSPDGLSLVTPDSMYLGYSLDKLYYQNQQTTQVLEDMRNLLQKVNDNLKEILKLKDDTGKADTNSLYYQDIEMISLLREIRALLRESSDRPEKK